METMKAEQLGTTRWRVLAIPFGGPLSGGKDLDGEYFSPRTDVKPHWFKERPVIFGHGQDETLADADIGIQGDLTLEEDGWWAEMWLDRASRYWAMVDRLIRSGKMYGSSGSLPHLVRKAADGEILVWPHVEQTLTPTPANPFARITASKAVAHFDSAGITITPALRELIVDLDVLADDLRADLSPDGAPSGYLSSGGNDVAMKRLATALDDLERLIRTI